MNTHPNPKGDQPDTPGNEVYPDRRFLIRLLVLILGLALASFCVRPLYRQAKVIRAQRLAHQIAAQLNAGPDISSLWKVQLMISLAPGDEQVLRAAARFCSTNHHPAAVTYWAMLLESLPGSREDHLAYARAAIDFGRYDVASSELAALIQRPGGDIDAARLALNLALKRGSWEFAARMADHVLQLDAKDDQAIVWRGLALSRTWQPEEIAKAKQSLLSLMIRSGNHWREAIDVLLEIPQLTGSEVALIRHHLHAAGGTSLEDRMRILSADWLGDGDLRAPAVAKALDLLSSARQDSDISMVGRWLLSHEAAEQILERFPLARSQYDRTRMQLYLLALARQERWQELSDLVAGAHTGLDAHFATVMSVVAAVGLKPKNNLQEGAMAVLADRAIKLPELVEAAQLAEENGLNEAAIYLLEALLDNPATMPEAANRILTLAGNVDRLSLRRRALNRLVDAFPKDRVTLPQWGYVEAVLPGGNLNLIERLDRSPGSNTNVTAQVACALGEVRRGKADAALARLMALTPPDQVTDYRLHLAYAAAYGSDGDFSAARRHAALAEAVPLHLEERELISRWLTPKIR